MNKVSRDKFIKALETGGFKGDGTGDGFLIPEDATMLKDVSFGNVNGRELLLDVFYREEKPVNPRPAIVFFHGGGFVGGSSIQFYPHAAYLAMKYDIFAVSVNYRLMQEAFFPAAVQDSKCAIRWVRSVAERYNIDSERIAVAGGSAGGNLAAMVAATKGMEEFEGDGGHSEYSSHANLAIAFNGGFDITDKARNRARNQQNPGKSEAEIIELFKKASPIYHVNKDMPPMLFLHGDEDTTVPLKQAADMFSKFRENGVPAEIEIYEGVGHGWFNKAPHLLPVLSRAEAFIVKYFKL